MTDSFVLVTIQPQKLSDSEALFELQELKHLVEAYGGRVVDLVVQKREIHDKGSYIGEGKIAELATIVKQKKVDFVVLNAIVKAGQLYDLKEKLYPSNAAILVWDRVDLILQIFQKHAFTAESKLQIELAAMRHMGPRIYGMGQVLSRQGGGIGTLGVGETNTELMKRHWREQMKKTKDKLTKLTTERQRQMQRRKRLGFKTVSLIGYTNAGKTSLFNALTKKDKYVENALFATLDSSVGKYYFKKIKKEVLFTDTIGFIQNLPPSLIDAFKSTLLETLHADILLHVIDYSDPEKEKKIHVVNTILKELGMEGVKKIYIGNKVDEISPNELRSMKGQHNETYFVSAKKGTGLPTLLTRIESLLA